jgi:molecular chaperone GrpE
LKNKDEMLEEKELLDSDAGVPEGPEGDKDMSGEDKDKPDTGRNIADSGEEGREDGDVLDQSGEKDKHAASSGKGAKAARKISRKELLKLISKKNDMLQQMEDEITAQEEELKIKEDRLLRIAAEFENYKKRTRREWELLEQRAKAELITDILGALDDFDRALEALGERDDHVADGVVLIVTGLKDILMRSGLREIEVLGKKFDPQYHEAVGGMESEDVEEGLVVHVVQKGYELNDQLLRPAKVIVSKKK